MNDVTAATPLPADVQQRIDRHLDAIDTALQNSTTPRRERRNVTDEVEGQIRDMLAERAGVQPSVADVEAILVELDPPEAYGDVGDAEDKSSQLTQSGYKSSEQACPEERRISRIAVVGLALVGVGIIPALFGCVSFLVGRGAGSGHRSLFLMSPALALVAVGAVCGLIASSQIRHSQERHYRQGVACASSLVFPLLLIDIVIGYVGRVLVLHARGGFPRAGRATHTFI
jgi:hypothetical protein